jgi:hypothetical protein
MGSIVEPEFSPVLDELIAVFGDEKRLEKAKQANNVIAKNFLNYEHVQNIAQTYYT